MGLSMTKETRQMELLLRNANEIRELNELARWYMPEVTISIKSDVKNFQINASSLIGLLSLTFCHPVEATVMGPADMLVTVCAKLEKFKSTREEIK